MAVSDELDEEIRQKIRALLEQVPSVIGADRTSGQGIAWPIEPNSPGTSALLLEGGPWPLALASIGDAGGADLALMTAGGFIQEAADGVALAGDLQVRPVTDRLAGFGPVLRSASEKAVTASWILQADTASARLARAGVVELSGLEWHMNYLSDDKEDGLRDQLARDYESLTSELDRVLGGRAVRRGSGGRVASVKRETLPTKTRLYKLVYEDIGLQLGGAAAYAEHSTYTHPTGYRRVLSSEPLSRIEGTQVVYDARSTVHDEGRLLETAMITLGTAATRLGSYVGRDLRSPLSSLYEAVVSLWQQWCAANDCGHDPFAGFDASHHE